MGNNRKEDFKRFIAQVTKFVQIVSGETHQQFRWTIDELSTKTRT